MDLAILIDRNTLRVAHRGKLVKSENYMTLANAQQILSQAELAAHDLQERARAEYRQQHDAGYRDGWAHAQAQFTQRALAHANEQAHGLAALQTRTVNVVMRALRGILREFDQQALLEQSLRRVAESLGEEKFVLLRVSPQQAAAAHAALLSLAQKFGAPNRIDVRADPGLAHGACVVESEHGVIDASLDTQLAAIERALNGSLAAEDKPCG